MLPVEPVQGAFVQGRSDGLKVSAPSHQPVLLSEALSALRVGPGGLWVDGTLGRGGHAEAILSACAPDGVLVGIDRDMDGVDACRIRLASFGERVRVHHGSFSRMLEWVGAGTCDGVLLDLGVSSPQLDVAERGFSFMRDGPLDMRMDRSQGATAADLVNGMPEAGLADVFWKHGDEPASRRIAKAIVEERRSRPLTRTSELAGLVERICPRGGRKIHPATRVFQALRIAVNEEPRHLAEGLAAACDALRPGGRLCVITFHSIEDRWVKDFGNERSRDYTFDGPVDVPELRKPRQPDTRWVQRKAIMPSDAEVAENPRARSAQLRVLEKLK